jgi:hypothetical protein
MRKHFGSSPPPVTEAERNISLLILSYNWVFNYPMPLMPSIVAVHSLHVKTSNDPLPKVSNRRLRPSHSKLLNLSNEHVTDRDIYLAVTQNCELSLLV